MRISHVVPILNSKVSVISDVLPELGIRNGSLLYAFPIRDESTILMSAIPPSLWDRAYRLTVYLKGISGSLGMAAQIVEKLGINLLASWSASSSSIADGCWTAIVEIPNGMNSDRNIEDLCYNIEDLLERENILTSSIEFKTGLRRVILEPRKVLMSLQNMVDKDNPFTGQIQSNTIDLNNFKTDNGNILFEEMKNTFFNKGNYPRFCLLTPDTEERYLRLTLIPSHTKMIKLSMIVKMISSESVFKGFFASVLNSFSDKRFRMNLFSSDNYMLSKSVKTLNNKEISSEVARFEFVADAHESKLPFHNYKELNLRLYKHIKKALDEHAKKITKVKVEIKQDNFKTQILDSLFNHCFFATNARSGEESAKWACELISRLRGLGLHPVNVDITLRPTLMADVTTLLKASAILVSLHVPLSKNRLKESAGISKSKSNYCPSDWVLFEESYMIAQDRPMLRIRHIDVREPQYAPGQRDYKFNDFSSFEQCLEELEKAIKGYQSSDGWIKITKECDYYKSALDSAWLNRDLYSAYGCK